MASYRCSPKWIPTPLAAPGAPPGGPEASQPRALTTFRRIVVTVQLSLLLWASEGFRLLFARFRKSKVRSVQQARRIRDYAERLGGIWVSLARLVSLRGDLLGGEFCTELGRTRDRGVPLPFPIIRQCVAEELRTLGKSFDAVFASFSETPLATRSFGQFHRARLHKDGQEVVVRVRTPDALKKARFNWRCMRISFVVAKKLGLAPHLRLMHLLFEVKKYTDNLLDFRTQVPQLLRIRQILRRHGVYVPAVHEELGTERLMVTEFLDTVSIAQLEDLARTDPQRYAKWMADNRVDRRKLWRRLFNAHQQLLFEHNVFHTDLSPFTTTVLKGNRLAFVGYNVIGTLDARLQQRYRQLHRALLDGDYTKVADFYLILGPPIPHKDLADMRTSVRYALRKWESRVHVKKRPYLEKSIAAALGHLARCTSEQGLPTSWSLARVHLAEQNLDQSLGFLDPTQSSIKAMGRYQRQAELRRIKKLASKKTIKQFNSTLKTAQLGGQLIENFQNDAEFLRHRLLGAQGGVGKLAELGGRLVELLTTMVLWAVALQAYLYFDHWRDGVLPPVRQGAVGPFLIRLPVGNRAAFIVSGLGVLLILVFLRRLARRLLASEGGPVRSG